MHRNENLGAKITKGVEGFFGRHMIFTKLRAVISPDGKEGNLRVKFFADFPESREVAGIAGVINGASAQIEDVASVAAVVIGDFTGAPMFGGNKGDGGAREAQTLPPFHFIDFFEAKAVDEVGDTRGDDDGLIGGNFAKAAAVEMIKVGVGYEHKVDGGKMVVKEAGVAETTHDEKPICPVRVD